MARRAVRYSLICGVVLTMRMILAVVSMVIFGGLNTVSANPFPEPKGPVILTVTGDFPNKTTAYGTRFDREMLKAIEWGAIKTHTNWHDGLQLFEGPAGRAFVEALGLEEDTNKTFRITALNGYEADVPVRDFFETGLILAMKRDGTIMTVRNKGPLFIIYPYDDNPDYNTDDYHIRSVWHIKKIHIH